MDFWLLVVIAVIAGVIVVIAKARKDTETRDSPWPFYAKKPLTRPEQVLYFRLRKSLPEHIVLAQVGLSRILGVKKGNNFAEWFNRINRMTADFVVCSRDLSVDAVIELDDASHQSAQRQSADARKDKALSSAGIRTIRWHTKSMPDEEGIRTALGYAQQSVLPDAPAAASRRPARG